MTGLARRDDELHRYGDYLQWPSEPRYELIDGLAYLMSAGPDLAHQDLVGEIRTFELGEVIAERRLTFQAEAGWAREVVIRLGRPRSPRMNSR